MFDTPTPGKTIIFRNPIKHFVWLPLVTEMYRKISKTSGSRERKHSWIRERKILAKSRFEAAKLFVVIHMSRAKLRDKLSRKSGDGSVVNDAMSDNEGDWCCAGCKQSWPESDKNKPELVGCCSCKGWFCRNCSKLKKSDISVLGRNDIFWACGNCTTKVTLLLDNSPSPTVQENELKRLTDTIAQQLKNLETKFENKIEQTIKDEIPKQWENTWIRSLKR